MFRNPEGGTARSQRQGRARRGIHEMAIIHEWVCPCGTLSGSSPTLHCPLYGLRIVSFMDEQPGAPFFILSSFASIFRALFSAYVCSSTLLFFRCLCAGVGSTDLGVLLRRIWVLCASVLSHAARVVQYRRIQTLLEAFPKLLNYDAPKRCSPVTGTRGK